MEMQNMGDDPAFVHNLDSVVNASQQFVKMACTAGCPDNNHPAKVTMATACMIGPLAAIAIMVAKDDKVTADSIMFAALLAAKAVGPVGDNALALNFSPAILLEAVEAFQKLTGLKAENVVCEGMVSAARRIEREGAIPLQSFLEAARKSKLN